MNSDYLYTFVSFLASLLTAIVAMPWLLRFCKKRGFYDIPNERKLHHHKIPRLGGVVFVPSALVGIIASLLLMSFLNPDLPSFHATTFVIMGGMFLIYLIGLLDDLFGLRASFKFAIQFVAALLMPFCGLYINNLYGFCGIYELPLWAAYPFTVLVSLLIVNSINLIDGIDGLAAGLSLMALCVFTALFGQSLSLGYSLFSVALIAPLLVFLRYNLFGSVVRGTKTFMGDSGSLILGYTLAYLAIKYAMTDAEDAPRCADPLLTSYTLVLIPTFDLVRVAIGRLRRHVSIFHADKSHIHHKFLAAGFNMHQTLAAILAVQVGFCLLNWGLHRIGVNTTVIVVADMLLFAILQQALDLRIGRRTPIRPQITARPENDAR